jgi:hypothetical protein
LRKVVPSWIAICLALTQRIQSLKERGIANHISNKGVCKTYKEFSKLKESFFLVSTTSNVTQK